MGQKSTILIVEDDPASMEMLREMFSMADYLVETASNIEQAASKMESGRYGAALVDLSLPGGTTAELITRFQKVSAKPPIIIFSARMPADLQAAAQKLGAAAVLQKPVRMEVLLSTVASVINSAA